MRRTSIDIRPEAYWFLCVCLLLLPLKVVAAWFLSVFVHEAFHYAALRLCRCTVPCVQIGAFGAKMETGPLTPGKELLCSAAGPLGGVFLFIFIKAAPLVAIFGILHTIFNLIPVFPLDGGRVLHCAIRLITVPRRYEQITSILDSSVILLLLILAVYGLVKLFLGPLPLIAVLILLFKNKKSKSSCKLSYD